MKEADVLKASIDCRSVIEADLGPPVRRSGNSWTWHCPYHKDTTPSLSVTSSYWKCFGACSKGGDIFDWVQDRQKMSFPQAKAYISQKWTGQTSIPLLPIGKTVSKQPQTAEFQFQMLEAAAECAGILWNTPEALAYLQQKRGLSKRTIQRHWLGYQPISGEIGGLYIPAGFIIPHFQGDVCIGIRIRCLYRSKHRYYLVPGSITDLYLRESLKDRRSGRRFAFAFLAEGELDALLLEDHIGDHAGVVTFGSAAYRQIDPWLPYLAPLQHIFMVTDNDPAGESAAAYFLAKLPHQAVRVLPPAGAKDITHAWQLAGGGIPGSQELRGWALGILGNIS